MKPMVTKVVLVPGIAGSILSKMDSRGNQVVYWGRTSRCWANVVTGTALGLRLNVDGSDPLGLTAVGILMDVYGDLFNALHGQSSFSRCCVIRHDWRLDMQTLGTAFAGYLASQAAAADVLYIVAHSMGGLLTRALPGPTSIRRRKPRSSGSLRWPVRTGVPGGGAVTWPAAALFTAISRSVPM